MLLGKRQRPSMRRTTSMTEFTLDLNNVETPAPSDPQNPNKDRQKLVSQEGMVRRNTVGGGVPDGFDQRFMSTVSPRNHRKNFVETAHFLRACGLCKRRLGPAQDIYMYRGDTAFCSLECRQQQMNQDERKEKCSLASAAGSQASSKGEKVAAA